MGENIPRLHQCSKAKLYYHIYTGAFGDRFPNGKRFNLFRSNRQTNTVSIKQQVKTLGCNLLSCEPSLRHVNKLQETGSRVNLIYSTLNCYLKALNSHHNITWPSKTEDMFPYVTFEAQVNATFKKEEEYQEYWTGFYTSRPQL